MNLTRVTVRSARCREWNGLTLACAFLNRIMPNYVCLLNQIMLAAFSAGKLVFWKSEKHLPYTLKRSLFSLDHNGALINFINLLALLLIWRGLWTYWPPTVSVGFILRMFLRLQKTVLVLILLFRFSSRSIAYNLFPGGFTPVGLDQGTNQGLIS